MRTHHHLGSYPAASRRYGLYRAGHLVGVAVYSIPVQAAVLLNALPDCEPYRESLELGRFFLADAEPGNCESWFIARCHTDLATTGIRGVVSFSDPAPRVSPDGTAVVPGHVGYIYQATNAVYTGRATARTLTLLRDGTILNDKTRQKIRRQEQGYEYAERLLIDHGARAPGPGQQPNEWLTTALHDAGARRIRHHGCHRYVFQLGTTASQRRRVRIALPALPYPKHPDVA